MPIAFEPEQHVLLLGANQHVLNALLAQQAQQQRQAGVLVWMATQVRGWEDWVGGLWQSLRLSQQFQELPASIAVPLPLGKWQELLLWEQVIAHAGWSTHLGERSVKATGASSPRNAIVLPLGASQGAELAQHAWGLLCQHQAVEWHASRGSVFSASAKAAFASTQQLEAKVFWRWAQVFGQAMHAQGWCSQAQVPSLVTMALRHSSTQQAAVTQNATINARASHGLKLPAQVIHHGFDILTPQHQALFAALQAEGVVVQSGNLIKPIATEYSTEHTSPPSAQASAPPLKNQTPDVRAYTTPQEELESALLWAREACLQHPQQQIAIVHPNLGEAWQQVHASSMRTFSPSKTLITHAAEVGSNPQPFNSSYAPPLEEQVLVQTASLLLQAPTRKRNAQQLVLWLTSPWLAGALVERTQRAHFAQWFLSEWVEPFSVAHVLKQTSAKRAPSIPLWQKHMQAWHKAWQPYQDAHQLPSQWAQFFADHLLPGAGWATSAGNTGIPAQRSLSSNQAQAKNKFYEVLKEMANLDGVQSAHAVWASTTQPQGGSQTSKPSQWNADQAFGWLKRMLAKTPFQPEGANASIHLLGILQASGLRFDHLWLLSVQEQHWPAAPNPSVLIPMAFQREQNLPKTNPVRELELSKASLKRLLGSAPQVVLSYAIQGTGGEVQNPSPLLQSGLDCASLPMVNPPKPDSISALATQLAHAQAHPPWQALSDTSAPPYPHTTLQNGASLLQNIALCPFKAFALHRLHLRPVELASVGISAQTHGQIVHRVLEAFWQHEAKTQQDLNVMLETKADFEAALQRSIARTIQSTHSSQVETSPNPSNHDNVLFLHPVLVRLQTKRLMRLLSVWLGKEATERTNFSVMQQEETLTITLAGMTLTLRLDRLDEVLLPTPPNAPHPAPNRGVVLLDYKTSATLSLRSWLEDARITQPQLPLYALAWLQKQQAQAAANQAQLPLLGLAFAQLHHRGMGMKGLCAAQPDGLLLSPPKSKSKLKSKPNKVWGEGEWPAQADLLARWQSALEASVGDFVKGVARVAPKDKACQHCALAPLCRIGAAQPPAAASLQPQGEATDV